MFPKKARYQRSADRTQQVKVRRRAGQSVREEWDRLVNDNLPFVIFVPCMLWFVWFAQWLPAHNNTHLPLNFWLYLAIIVTGASAIAYLRLIPKARRLVRGERGELRVAEVLDDLRPFGYRAFHDLIRDGFNIDHVVVGPAGVFAVETKFRRWRDAQARGGGIQNLRFSQLAELEVVFPSLEEQRRIAARLRERFSPLGEARTALEAQLRTADALSAANLRAVFETSESKEWPTKTVGEMIQSGTLTEHQDGNHGELHPRNRDFVKQGVKFVTAKHIGSEGRVLLDSAPCISEEQATGLRIGFARANDVLLAHNATVGKVGIAPQECQPFVVGTSLTIYRANSEVLEPKFVFYALSAAQFQKQLVNAMQQTTRNQVPITKQRTLSFPMPPLSTQCAIASRLDAASVASEELRASIGKKLLEVENLPGALLRSAFSADDV